MKERTIVATVVASLVFVGILATGNTDVIFVAVNIALFAVGIAYVEGCEKL